MLLEGLNHEDTLLSLHLQHGCNELTVAMICIWPLALRNVSKYPVAGSVGSQLPVRIGAASAVCIYHYSLHMVACPAGSITVLSPETASPAAWPGSPAVLELMAEEVVHSVLERWWVNQCIRTRHRGLSIVDPQPADSERMARTS